MMDSVEVCTTAFSAFQEQLKTLCLKEFPCGKGSWREELPPKSHLEIGQKLNGKFAITLREYGIVHESTEALLEYITSKWSPWKLDYSWSNEAEKLRKVSVISPLRITEHYVMSQFKTLRIVDKKVSEVDPGLLQFIHLEELTLSANHIVGVNSKNLPPELKVLELCSNQLSDLSGLCIRPPPLIHLGLGYNKVSFIGDYLTGDFWPRLLSLDLSHNKLCDLLDVVSRLATLPKLNNLVLNGNPLSLIAGYRGYTIDSLRNLNILDDIRISADERHHFKGLAKRREFILDEAKVYLEVKYMKGIPMPEEIKNPEEQPEFPIIERQYLVQFMFLEDSGEAATDVLDITTDQMSEIPSVQETERTQPCIVSHQEATEEHSLLHRAVTIIEDVEEAILERDYDGALSEGSDGNNSSFDQTLSDEIKLAPVKTPGQPWSAEVIEVNWVKAVTRDDLLGLSHFLKEGMHFSIIEEKVLGYPPEPPLEGSSPTDSSKKAKDNKADKKKDEKVKSGKDKKKKKDVEENLIRTPPEITVLATFHIPLADFLDGEFDFESVYTESTGLKDGKDERSIEDDRKDTKSGKKKSSSPKSGKTKEAARKPSAKPAGGKDAGHAAGKSKGGSDKMGIGTASEGAGGKDEDVEAMEPPAPPLEVHIAVRLHHWKTAHDSVREEEEKQKAMKEES